MKILTKEWVRSQKFCNPHYNWWLQTCEGLETTHQIKKIAAYDFNWAHTLIVKILPYPQWANYVIIAAKQVYYSNKFGHSVKEELSHKIDTAEAYLTHSTAVCLRCCNACREALYETQRFEFTWLKIFSDSIPYYVIDDFKLQQKIIQRGINLLKIESIK